MPTRIAATAVDTPPAYSRLINYAQSWREGPARQAICGLPTAGDLGPALLLICSLIEVIYDRPISFAHGSRRMCNHHNIQAIERYIAVTATIDMEGKGGLTISFRRLGGQRRLWRKEAGTHYRTVAVLAILSCYAPVRPCCSHLSLHVRVPACWQLGG